MGPYRWVQIGRSLAKWSPVRSGLTEARRRERRDLRRCRRARRCDLPEKTEVVNLQALWIRPSRRFSLAASAGRCWKELIDICRCMSPFGWRRPS